MEVYINAFVLLFALAALDVYSGRKAVSRLTLGVGTVLLVLLIGLRWETGNDWGPYLHYYRALQGDPSSSFEPGYRALVWVARRAGLEYSTFLTLSAAIYMSAFAVVFSRFRHPAVLLLLFYSVYLLGFMGTQRQTLALGFTSLAILRFYDRKNASALALVLVGMLFHYTAIISLLAIAVPRSRLSLRAVAAVLLAASALYYFDVIGSLIESGTNALVGGEGYLARRLLAYSAGGEWVQASTFGPLMELLWLVKRIALVVVFWLLCSRERRSLDNYLVNLYVLSVVVFLVTYKGVPLLALRGPLYFALFEIGLTCLALQRLGGWFRRESLLWIGGVLAAARLYAGIMLYAPDLYVPYKSVVVNTDYARFTY
ncbi:MAG TPA: EpsG family protein [Gammaproteobacteria bacterium]